MAEKTELNYDQVQGFVKSFKAEADDIQALAKDTSSRANALHGDGWVGQGADKFIEEMNGEILPAMERLVQALNTASEMAQKISETYSQAEEETQGYFNSLGE